MVTSNRVRQYVYEVERVIQVGKKHRTAEKQKFLAVDAASALAQFLGPKRSLTWKYVRPDITPHFARAVPRDNTPGDVIFARLRSLL